MFRNRQSLFISCFIVFTLIFSLLLPSGVLADDGTPPPDPASEEVVTTEEPASGVATQEPAATDVPAATESPAVTEIPVEETPATSEAVEPTEPPAGSVTEEPAEESNAGLEVFILNEEWEAISLADEGAEATLLNGQPIWCPAGTTPETGEGCTASFGSLGQLVEFLNANPPEQEGAIYIQTISAEASSVAEMPSADLAATVGENATEGLTDGLLQGADVVVLDEQGQALPLVSQEAMDAIINGDPIWCPSGVAPTPNAAGCTGSYSSLGALVTFLQANQPTRNGTIWIQEGNDTSGSAVVIDGSVSTTWGNYSLTLQGGWNGTYGSTAVTGTTTFANSISVLNWLNNVAVNEIVVLNTSGTGLSVDTTGNIALDNVSSNGNAGDGANLKSGSGSVTLTGTNTFNNNSQDGLEISTNGNLNVNNLTANGNAENGAWLDNCKYTQDTSDPDPDYWYWYCAGSSTGSVNLTGTNTFNANGNSVAGGDGLHVTSNGDVRLSNLTSNNNYREHGVFVESGSTIMTGTNVFNDNRGYGAWIGGENVQLENLNTNSNGEGVWVFGANVTVTGTNVLTGDWGDSLKVVGGDINVENLTVTDSGGIHLETWGGSVRLAGTNYFNNNNEQGHVVFIQGLGDVYVEGVTSINGFNGDGIKIGSLGNVTINSSSSTNNSEYGLEVGFLGWDPFAGQEAAFYPASLTLNGVTLCDNGFGDLKVNDAGTVVTINQSTICDGSGVVNPVNNTVSNEEMNPKNDSSTTPSVTTLPTPVQLPLNKVNLENDSAGPTSLDCTKYSGTELRLSNGSSVTYSCPISGEAGLTTIENKKEALPGSLPKGVSFVSALSTKLTEGGASKDITSGLVTISFVIPADLLDASLTVLYWDGSKWVDLSAANFTDGKKVFNIGIKAGSGTFEVQTNFTGIFVLAKK